MILVFLPSTFFVTFLALAVILARFAFAALSLALYATA